MRATWLLANGRSAVFAILLGLHFGLGLAALSSCDGHEQTGATNAADAGPDSGGSGGGDDGGFDPLPDGSDPWFPIYAGGTCAPEAGIMEATSCCDGQPCIGQCFLIDGVQECWCLYGSGGPVEGGCQDGQVCCLGYYTQGCADSCELR